MNKKRILIIDDEAGSARLLKSNLEQTGRYDVRVEIWPENAVGVALEFKPDLVLLDILMPRKLGGNVAAAFRANPELKAIPIIFLTAVEGKSIAEQHQGVIGGTPIITKPAGMEEIVRCIEQHLPTEHQ